MLQHIVVKQGIVLIFDFLSHLLINQLIFYFFLLHFHLGLQCLKRCRWPHHFYRCPLRRRRGWVELSHRFALYNHLGDLFVQSVGCSQSACCFGCLHTLGIDDQILFVGGLEAIDVALTVLCKLEMKKLVK